MKKITLSLLAIVALFSANAFAEDSSRVGPVVGCVAGAVAVGGVSAFGKYSTLDRVVMTAAGCAGGGLVGALVKESSSAPEETDLQSEKDDE